MNALPQDRRRTSGVASAWIGAAAAGLLAIAPGCPSSGDAGFGDDEVLVEQVAGGLTAPVALAAPDDGSGRLFVASQIGLVRVVQRDGTVLDAPLLDLRDRIVALDTSYDERGLLGLALHPDFAENGRLFVYYTVPPRGAAPPGTNAQNLVSEFRMSDDDEDRADPESERVILAVDQPGPNHNGGQIAFGPDGMLYISKGDGGGAGDTGDGHTPGIGNGQDLDVLLGKILRIDVDGDAPYAIPPDNPFVDRDDARPEVWAYGLRNPWRFSFDAGAPTPRLFAGDVGQNRMEEVNLIDAGANYGWRIREGDDCFDPDAPLAPPDECAAVGADGQPLRGPILRYSRADGTSVVGGFVYRGREIESLIGAYVFADYSSSFLAADGRLFAAREAADGTWSFDEIRVRGGDGGRIGRYIYALGTDADGELYVLTNTAPAPRGTGGELLRLRSPQ